MPQWEKKPVAAELVKELAGRYGTDMLTASVLVRRGLTTGKDLLFFLEDDKRYLHNPFLFSTMEDAVDRILDAREEGEKVLIFGDRDVDGVTSTALLYDYLLSLGMDVSYRVPQGDEAYGLSKAAIDEFAASYGSLIITVDCGISNIEEIAYANEKQIDVIVTDHHNPQDPLPAGTIVVNPKVADCGYPFKDISGCAVAYKLVSALRFAQTELYKQEICLMNLRPINEGIAVECIKTQNLVVKERFTETYMDGLLSIQNTRLLPFLRGQQIFVWDGPVQQKMLTRAFGTGVEFNFLDLRPQAAQLMPSLGDMSLLRLKSMSRIALYDDSGIESTEIDAFYNIFVTFIQKSTTTQNTALRDDLDLQLVALAALADIMPMKDENRILVRQGINAMNRGTIRPGLLEICNKQGLLGKRISATDLSWSVTPVLNSAGRLGEPGKALDLLTEKDAGIRERLACEIMEMNRARKDLGNEAWGIAEHAAWESLATYSNNMTVCVDKRINRGVTGITANKLAQTYKVPSVVITYTSDTEATGSIRSARGYDVCSLLNANADLFTHHGGHDFAGGFGLPAEKVPELLERFARYAPAMEFPEAADLPIAIDAELPEQYLTPDILKLVDRFEPYGPENPPLTFLSQRLQLMQADVIGKVEKVHLKLTFNCGRTKWPALWWNSSEHLKRDFDVRDRLDVVYQINRNTFNGIETPQMMVTTAEKSH
ncbi:MAG: single-stranded-DNA-specific exonuclease RecJ [Treponemataceae bacterium]|nr:single-stranded-DNA-specific exonuclease RecJ [Treponemataceae bacterium]